jgi:tetratricopeptide (TPR) repeat protein
VVVLTAALVGRVGNHESESRAGGSLAAAVTGTTDRLTAEESSTGPTVPPASGFVQPSRQEWAALLPRLQKMATDNPEDVNALRKLALAHYNLDHLGEAESIYKHLLSAKEDPVLRDRLGNTLRDLGDASAAEKAYRQAIADDPMLAPPYLNLAEMLWRQGRDADAVSVLQRGLASVNEETRPLLQKGLDFLRTSE